MNQADGGVWSRVWHQRAKTTREDARKRSRKRAFAIGLSYVLLFGVCWSVLAIYVPVIKAEFGYGVNRLSESKRGNEWWSFLVPDFRFDLVPDVIASEWGLVIPKIYLQEKVVANVDPTNKHRYMTALNVGIAHAAGTELPGQGGLGYYFAHSSGMNVLAPQKEAAFYLLGKLETGDEVYVYNFGKKYRYRVTETMVVEANDVRFLQEKPDVERIVLQTCWPIGTSAKRLLVFADLI
jgi:LPXTG-site transpeptidase (sortase) family protein